MARTTYFRAAMILVAIMVAVLMAVLAPQKPAEAIVVPGGLCLPGPGANCPPETEITYGPSGTVSAYYVLDWASFEFRGDDDLTASSNLRFECRLDSTSESGWIPCTSPQDYSDLSNGTHTFEVRAIDSSGKKDATPAGRTWTIDTTKPPLPDTTPPETYITSPLVAEPNPNVSVNFTGRDPFGGTATADLEFECSLEGAAFEPCTSPKEYRDLSNGRYSFEVRAIDSSGNVDASPARYPWEIRVDTTPPDTEITSKPSDPSSGKALEFVFRGIDDVSNISYFMCRFSPSGSNLGSEEGWTYCGWDGEHTPSEITTSGNYTFEVYAVDGWGRKDPSPASYTWTVDATAPSAPIITSPAEGARLNNGSFSVSGTAEAGAKVRLFEGVIPKGEVTAGQDGNWSIVPGSVAEGSYTYKAKATDQVGNDSTESEARTVIVDTSRPTVKSTTPLDRVTRVGRGISPTATFSEEMNARTINANIFRLFRVNRDRSTTQITNVTVSLSSDGLKATLNPFGSTTTVLAQNTKYKAVVTTGAKDLAGNSLAQQESWTFTTR